MAPLNSVDTGVPGPVGLAVGEGTQYQQPSGDPTKPINEGGASSPKRPKYTLADIMADVDLQSQLVSIGYRRFQASALYVQEYQDKWLRLFKLYRNIVDTVQDPDEPNTGIVYAFSLVEDAVSRLVEPILQMKPPCRVAARRTGHEDQANRFSAMASSYFRTSRFQVDYTNSTRELAICGNAWEKDVWWNNYVPGRRWAKIKNTILTPLKNIWGRLTGQSVPTEYEDIQEVDHQYPEKVGYGVEFPAIWRVYPEPQVFNVRDMNWLCEEVPAAVISDLEKRMTIDPKTGQQVPFFDFSALKKEYIGKQGEIRPEPMSRQRSSAEDELRTDVGDQPERDRTLNYADDVDRVSLMWCWEKNRVFVIAQGRFIVAYQEDVFQVPRIPYRLKVYTPQKDFLFGLGILEPVENQINELSDIHRLSMRNWVRIINRMVAYDEGAIPFEDDFTPSALGRVRVRPSPGRTVAESVVPISHDDVTQSMLAQESNVKGIIERAISIADYSPGTEGTKQTHKTLGGLMEIQKNLAVRISTVQRMLLASFQDQMFFMEKLTAQFLMSKQPFTVYGPDGSTVIQEFDLWDIDTQGEGFDYIIEYDPSFGDDQVARAQAMSLMQISLQIYGQCKAMNIPMKTMPNIEYLAQRLYQKFGWSDTSRVMSAPDDVMNPDDEIKMMISGQAVKPNPKENVFDHLAHHKAQEQLVAQAIQAGKLPPKVMLLLKAHEAATKQMVSALAENYDPLTSGVIRDKMAQNGGGIPGMAPGAAADSGVGGGAAPSGAAVNMGPTGGLSGPGDMGSIQ